MPRQEKICEMQPKWKLGRVSHRKWMTDVRWGCQGSAYHLRWFIPESQRLWAQRCVWPMGAYSAFFWGNGRVGAYFAPFFSTAASATAHGVTDVVGV